MDPIHQELLRQAVEAAKVGDINSALIKVKEVLEEDEANAKAWMLLARLTTNNDEKRIALATLLQLEPNNTKAKELLAKLDTQVKTRDEEEVLPGVSRRLLRFIVGGLAGFVVLMLLLIVIIGQNRSAAEAQQTQVARNDLATAMEFSAQQTRQLEQQTQVAVDITAAFVTVNPPTPTLTRTPFPSETPLPSATPTATLVPLPADLTGLLVGRSGRNPRLDAMQPLVIFPNTRGAPTQIGTLSGLSLTTFAGGSQFAIVIEDINNNYAKEVQLQSSGGFELRSNLSATETIRAFFESLQAFFSYDGLQLVIVGTQLGLERDDLYLMTVNAGGRANENPTPEGTSEVGETNAAQEVIRKLSIDDASYRDPAISPDGTKIVVVRDVIQLQFADPIPVEDIGPDLVIIDVASGTMTSLTTDRSAMIESMPRWDMTSSLVVYTARPQGETNNEIYFIDVRNPDSGQIRISLPDSDEYKPIFSPDGKYLAYTSNVTGKYQIYIQNLSTNEVFQLTDGDTTNILDDWR